MILSQLVLGAGAALDESVKRSLLQEVEALLAAADTNTVRKAFIFFPS